MGKFLLELASWYWWISVVLVGILINLASAYAKPWIDRWLSRRSATSRLKRAALTGAFEAEVARLASDPTLLLIGGQRLQNAQIAVLSISTILGFFLALGFFFGESPPTSLIGSILQIGTLLVTVIFMILFLVFMRRESELDDKVRAARTVYENGGR